MLLLHQTIVGAQEPVDPDLGGSGERPILLGAILVAGEGAIHAEW